jgi:probable F420-dependent oxidoreductase
MIRLGLAVPIVGFGLQRSLDVAAHAESLGFDDLWTTEVTSHDAFALQSAVAARTTTIRLGIGLVPAFTRAPGLIAMAAATLQHISGGRAILGVGASNRQLVEGRLGGRYQPPTAYLRELVDVLGLMATGERVDYAGRFIEVTGFRLGLGATELPIMLGGMGPRMVKLAGEIADGLLTHLVSADQLRTAVEWMRAGAGTAGRGFMPELVARVPVSIGAGGTDRDVMFTRYLISYIHDPAYNRSLRAQGFGAVLDRLEAARRAGGGDEDLAVMSRELRGALIAAGRADTVLRLLRSHVESGATTLVIALASAAADPVKREAEIVHAIEEVARRRAELEAA